MSEPTTVCGLARTHPGLCCWNLSQHGPATYVLTLDYGGEVVEHHVCDYCTSEAERGRLPSWHDDAALVAVAASAPVASGDPQ